MGARRRRRRRRWSRTALTPNTTTSLTLTLTLTSFLSTASSSRSWTGKVFSPSPRSLEQRPSPWTTQDFVEGSPTGSFWRPTRRTRSRPLGPEILLLTSGLLLFPSHLLALPGCFHLMAAIEKKINSVYFHPLMLPTIHSCC